MAENYLKLIVTESVRKAQQHYFGASPNFVSAPERDALTEDEIDFIGARDSFYMATTSENGWPYMQHRGGRAGFLRVLNPHELAFADYRGNRQMLSTGNLAANNRVALFLMDYPQRTRLKILGHARVEDARSTPTLCSNWPSRMFNASWNAYFSLISYRSIGIVRNTLRRAIRRMKSGN
jgi:predicted pyridoxine 5'-phosphate oxidase superfamily flavin-nucleotide-binding protein